MRHKQGGITLVELMVVVAVVAVLASIAYPMYSNQVLKGRRADAKTALQTVALAQERYYSINGRYAVGLGSLAIDADLQAGDSRSGYYSLNLAIGNGGQTFSVSAAANTDQASDSCNNFTVDYLGVQSNSGPASCW